MSYHPTKANLVATAGGDGHFTFWDVMKRSRIRHFGDAGGAISAAAFSRDGSMYAYAVGYDWAMGHAKNTPDYPRKLMVHRVTEEDLTKQ